MKITPVTPHLPRGDRTRDSRPFEATNIQVRYGSWCTTAVHRHLNTHRENDRQPLTVVTPASLDPFGRTKHSPQRRSPGAHLGMLGIHKKVYMYRPLPPLGIHKPFALYPCNARDPAVALVCPGGHKDRNDDESSPRRRTRPYFFVNLFRTAYTTITYYTW